MKINNTTALKNALRAGPYAWPGGYPTFFLTAEGDPLCHQCVRDNFKLVLEETRHPSPLDGWRTIGHEINYEDAALHCAHCGEQIEAAYGEQQ
jgi:hypothetical protein